MSDFLKKVAKDRAGGDRPGVPRAMGAAIAVGATVAVVTYRVLRH